MRRLAPAVLLLVAVLAAPACAGGPIHVVPPELVGTWYVETLTDGLAYEAVAGTRSVVLVSEWDFRSDGSYEERHFARELVRGTASQSAVYTGTWGVRARRIRLSVRAAATADPRTAPWPVLLQPAPVPVHPVDVTWRLDGEALRLTWRCEGDAACPDLTLRRR